MARVLTEFLHKKGQLIAHWLSAHLPKQACAGCESGDCLELESLRKADDEGSWVTINGTHVHLNAAGEVDKGPKELLGGKTEGLGPYWHQSSTDTFTHFSGNLRAKISQDGKKVTVFDSKGRIDKPNTEMAARKLNLISSYEKDVTSKVPNELQGKIVRWGVSKEQKEVLDKYGIKIQSTIPEKLSPGEYEDWKEAANTLNQENNYGSKQHIINLTGRMLANERIHPVLAYSDKVGGFYIEDGHHRFLAAQAAGEKGKSAKIAFLELPSVPATRKAFLADYEKAKGQ